MRRLLILSLFAVSFWDQSPVVSAWGQSTWTQVCGSGGTSCGTPTPREVLYGQNRYDPVSGKMMLWMSSAGSASIYNNSWYLFNTTGPNYFTAKETSGTTTETCPADTSTAPGDRHPLAQWWVDTLRNRKLVMGGTCMGAGANRDMGWADLTAGTPSWTYFNVAATPHYSCGVFNDNLPCGQGIAGSVYYDSDVDMYVYWGYDGGGNDRGFSLYCPTDLNPTPGTLTTAQANAGCGTSAVIAAFGGPVADAWVEQSTNYATQPTVVGGSNLVSALPQHSANMIYDSVNHLGVLIASDATYTNVVVWVYNASTRTWTLRSPSGSAPASLADNTNGNESGVSPTASVGGGKIWYHPANLSASSTDYLYDVTANTWTGLGNLGGTVHGDSIVYIPSSGKMYMAADPTNGGGSTQVWVITATTFSVPLTVQERLYPGDQTGHTDHLYNASGGGGVARSNEPFCVGVPIADSTSITDTSQLSTDQAAGQFRILASWPDGHAKWIEVCTIASLSAGGTATVTFNSGTGAGNFPAGNLATDNGSTITVATGAAIFTLKKANHNGIDIADVGSTHLTLTGTSSGFIINGPDGSASYPGNVTCSPDSGGTTCNHVYSSVNDSGSTCSIEKNGPVQPVVKCDWTFKDAGGHSYMKGTARYYFGLNRASLRITTILRNADAGTTNTLSTAFKGHQGLEFHTGVNITGTTNYTFGCETDGTSGGSSSGCSTGVETGTMSGTDSIYLYQSQAHWMKTADWCTGSSGCIPLTTDTGYTLVKTVSGTPSTISSDTTDYANNGVQIGWADIANGSGVGIEIGVPDAPGVELKSLEFRSGGTDAVLGLLAPQNSVPYYEAYPQHEVFESVLNFHATSPASLTNSFRTLQAPLIARADYTYYNNTGVFPYTLISPSEEDAWYTGVGSSANPNNISPGNACCTLESGFNGYTDSHGWKGWNSGSGANQTEFAWSYLLNFLTRGFSGRYLDAAYFYRLLASHGWPSADFAGGWRSTTNRSTVGWICNNGVSCIGTDTQLTSANRTKASLNWQDADTSQLMEHFHWYGMPDFYLMSGDETIKDAILTNLDWFEAASSTYQGSGKLITSRAAGVYMTGASRFYTFLGSIGSSTDAATVLAAADNVWNVSYAPDECMSGYPSGCTIDYVNHGGFGTNRKRGAFFAAYYDIGPWCTSMDNTRQLNAFMLGGLVIPGGLEYTNVKGGPSWSGYWNALDLLYGMARGLISAFYFTDGSTLYNTNGWYYKIAYDVANSCDMTGDFVVVSAQTIHLGMLPLWMVDGGTSTWANKIRYNWMRLMSNTGVLTSDYSAYTTANMIHVLNNPGTSTLHSLTPTVMETSSGVYTVTWTTPASTSLLRVKYSTLPIVDWISFNILNNTFTGNPASTTAWFAATNATGIPSPVAGTQSMSINVGTPGLSAANFSVKAMSLGGGGDGGTTLSGKVTITGATVH